MAKERTEAPVGAPSRWLPLLLAMAMFVLVVDTTIMNVSISAVAEDLGSSVSSVQSAIALEALVSAAFILINSKLGDLMGRKRAYIIGLIAYAIGAVAMTLAQSVTAIIVFWAIIGGLGVIIATRHDPAKVPANSAVPLDTVGTTTATAVEGSVVDTTPETAVEGSGTTPACPDGTDTIGTGTLYLGGPASDQNLATKGFIFSLPEGRTAIDVAMKSIELPVVGFECSITGSPTSDPNVVRVTVRPPAVPTPLQLDVTIAQRDGVAGVTAIAGSTTFKVTNTGAAPSLQLLSGVPASTARVAVRFKKGDDVWELTADPTLGTAIALTVPGGETDKFASDPVDWVLFTLIDANERIVGAGGALI